MPGSRDPLSCALAAVRALLPFGLVCTVMLGCSAPGDAPGQATAKVPEALLAKICKADYVDATSSIRLGRDSGGVVKRLVVSPTRKIADMGEMVFDMDGVKLGVKTGGEMRYDDPAELAKERARIEALLAGAEVDNREEPLRCP